MPFLSLSGIEVPNISQWRYVPRLLGANTPTFSGFPGSSVRRKLMDHEGTCDRLTLADARLYRALIDGEGHSWAFESGSLTSSRGAAGTYTGAVGAFASGAKYGSSRLVLGVGSRLTWSAIDVTSDSTVAFWLKVPGVGFTTWRYVVAYPATEDVYVDGVLTYPDFEDGGDSLLAVLGVELAIVGDSFYVGCSAANESDGDIEVDDLVFLPYVAPLAWMEQVRVSGAAFGALPYHPATGDGLHRPCVVRGNAKGGDAVEFWQGGSHVLGESFSFDLMEAP